MTTLIGFVVSIGVNALKHIQSAVVATGSDLIEMRSSLERLEAASRVLARRSDARDWEIIAVSEPPTYPDNLWSPSDPKHCIVPALGSGNEQDRGKKRWSLTFSVLNYQRLQDLLWSPDYLEHFFQIGQVTELQYRVVVVSDHKHRQVGLKPFQQLSKSLNIKTAEVTKSEWYSMINNLGSLIQKRPKDVMKIGNILLSNPDLSIVGLKYEELRESHPDKITLEPTSFLLRYEDTSGKIIDHGLSSRADPIDLFVLRWVCWILLQGTRGRQPAKTPFNISSLKGWLT